MVYGQLMVRKQSGLFKGFLQPVILFVAAGLLCLNCSGRSLLGVISSQKMAIIMPGSQDDQDYNQLAVIAGEQLIKEYNIPVSYHDQISVASLPGKVDEQIEDGVNILWLHGGQYNSQAYTLASRYPGVVFIIEGDEPPEASSNNIWFIDRNFNKGMYVLGRLAAMETETGVVGYISGLNMPFSYIELHAIQQGLADSGKNVTLIPTWTGDFNDPELARIATEELIDQNVDVIIGSLNAGMAGLIETIENSERGVIFTAKYTDKSALSPDHYVTSFLIDFSRPLIEIVNSIIHQETSGYLQLEFNKGHYIQQPLQNVQEMTRQEIPKIIDAIKNNQIVVVKNSKPEVTAE